MKKIFIIHILLAMPLLAWCDNITFADAEVKAICVKNWDTNGDGELSKEEAAAVNDLGRVFERNTSIKSFDELQFFTGLTTMWNSEFYGCTGLVSIAIPNSVTTILSCVFQDCSALKSFSFSDGLTYIGSAAFDHCTSLTSVTIPDNVKNISYGAFSNCSALTSFTLGSGVEAVDNWIVNNCNRLTKIVVRAKTPPDASLESFTNRKNLSLYVPKGSKAAYQAADHWKEFKEIVEYDGDENINFADAEVKAICVKNWDTNGDGELSKAEAAAVKDLGEVFKRNTSIKSFDELQYFTGLTIIGSSAFYNSYRLTNVTIPSSVTSIEGSAFLYCYGLANIKVDSGNKYYDSRDACNAIIETKNNILIAGCKNTIIPNSVTSIGNSAFLGCRYLTSIDIPNSVTSIGEGAFSGCTGLTSITIPSSVTSIGGDAFNMCHGLTSITIPSSVTSIGAGAFKYCWRLTFVSIPNSVTSIGEGAFSGCSGLTSIKVDSGNKYYDSRDASNAIIETKNNTLIAGCKNTIIPNSVTSIGSYAFQESDLTSITIPSSVTSIGERAFSYCTVLTSITIPSSVTLIGSSAFSGCTGLTSITIPSSVTSIGVSAFSGCSGLTSITIPSSVKSINSFAFSGCSGLTSITIPSSVTSINSFAFSGCDRLTSVKVERATPVTVSSSTFSNRANATLYVPKGSKVAYQAANYWKEFKEIVEYEYEVDPEYITFADAEVKAICVKNWDTNGDGELSKTEAAVVKDLGKVFSGNQSIKSFDELQYFKGLASICDNAFNYCLSLASIIFPNSVTSIGYHAFYECKSLTSVTIPGSVEAITEAFVGCTGLTSISIQNGVRSIGYEAFSGCTGVTSLIIPKSVTHIESYAFIGFSGVVSIIVDSENTVYDSRNNCNAIIEKSSNTLVLGCKYTVIPNSVTSIGQGAFYKCTNLTSITIPNSVTSIGASAFWGCESLRSVTIPRSVTSIGNSAFYSYVGSGWVENALFDVKVENPNPVDISNGTFFGLRDIMLYVPKGSKAAYQAAAYWKEFKTILEFPDTDVNQDGATDVVDVVDIARYVVGSPSDSFHEFLADLNSDDKVNVADAVVLVNDIAGNTSFAKAWHRMQSSDDVQEQLMLTKNKDNSLSLSMDNNRAYTAFQFDLMMNIDMNVMQMLLNDSRKNGHQLLYNKVGDGHYRVVALSTANNSFNGKNGELLNIQLDGFDTDDLTIHNVHFFTGQGNDYAFDDLKLQGGTTAIGELPLVESDQPTAVYDLQGRKQPTLRRGVNIVNGKKVIIK